MEWCSRNKKKGKEGKGREDGSFFSYVKVTWVGLFFFFSVFVAARTRQLIKVRSETGPLIAPAGWMTGSAC